MGIESRKGFSQRPPLVVALELRAMYDGASSGLFGVFMESTI